jgi:hypothetical protein
LSLMPGDSTSFREIRQNRNGDRPCAERVPRYRADMTHLSPELRF